MNYMTNEGNAIIT